MRTVEMGSWTESRLARHDRMGHGYDITFDNHSRALNPEDSIDIRMSMVHASPTSADSSASGPSSRFHDRQSR